MKKHFILGSVLAFLTLVISAQAMAIECRRDEQKGCLSIQVLNFLWEEDNPLMTGLNRLPTSKERYDRVVKTAPRLYKGFKSGTVQAASPMSVTIYLWNINEAGNQVGEIRYAAMKPHNMRGKYFKAKTVSPKLGAIFDPVNGLDDPDVAFGMKLDGFASVLGVPWDMIGNNTYILICPVGQTVVPNRITAKNGYWITPEFLDWMKKNDKDYVLTALLSSPL
jgi:hypothetical protein